MFCRRQSRDGPNAGRRDRLPTMTSRFNGQHEAGRVRAGRLTPCSGGSAFQARFRGAEWEQICEPRFDPAEAS